MNDRDLRIALHDVYQRYSDNFSDEFKDDILTYYSMSASMYVNHIKNVVAKFENLNDDTKQQLYAGYITDVKAILNGDNATVEQSKSPTDSTNATNESTATESFEQSVPSESSESESKSKTNQSQKSEQTVKTTKTQPTTTSKSTQKTKSPKRSTSVQSEQTGESNTKVAKPTIGKQHQSSVKQGRRAKIDIDMSDKNLKVVVPNGLANEVDLRFKTAARLYLIQSGELTVDEATTLSNDTGNENRTVYRDHDFRVTQSDIYIMLMLMGLHHLNVDLKDGYVEQMFDDNELKIDFFNNLMNTNLVELDVQSRVRRLQQKMEKADVQNQQLLNMLSHLLLERANVPKNQNRETIKKAIETSSVMNQATEAFDVLEGVVGSRISTIKDYKERRGNK